MSDTPRTDALEATVAVEADYIDRDAEYNEMANLARTLERDLQECVELLVEMEPHIDSLICYGSTCLEYKPNDFVRRYRALLARLKEKP